MEIKLKPVKSKIFAAIISGLIVAISSGSLFLTIKDLFIDQSLKKDNQATIDQYEKQFFEITNQLINSNDTLVIDIETVRKIFNSVDRKSNGKLFTYGFINVLEDYSVNLISDSSKNNKLGFRLIISLINEELKGEPFNQLKPEQKRILLNLQKSIISGDKNTSLYNLNELNDVFRVQNDNLFNFERQNAWSIPLAIAGLVLTLFFGVFSLIKSLSKKENDK